MCFLSATNQTIQPVVYRQPNFLGLSFSVFPEAFPLWSACYGIGRPTLSKPLPVQLNFLWLPSGVFQIHFHLHWFPILSLHLPKKPLFLQKDPLLLLRKLSPDDLRPNHVAVWQQFHLHPPPTFPKS